MNMFEHFSALKPFFISNMDSNLKKVFSMLSQDTHEMTHLYFIIVFLPIINDLSMYSFNLA